MRGIVAGQAAYTQVARSRDTPTDQMVVRHILPVVRVSGAAVATLLAVATLAQVLAEVVQRPRREVAGMKRILRVASSSTMVTVSAVSTSTAMASSTPSLDQ